MPTLQGKLGREKQFFIKLINAALRATFPCNLQFLVPVTSQRMNSRNRLNIAVSLELAQRRSTRHVLGSQPE
jgi:hypothetical protein